MTEVEELHKRLDIIQRMVKHDTNTDLRAIVFKLALIATCKAPAEHLESMNDSLSRAEKRGDSTWR